MLTRSFHRAEFQTRDSGAADAAYTIHGHAAVFNKPCDFKVFTEYIAPGAFERALAVKPLEVVSNWQHDDRWTLGTTMNATLALSEDDIGLKQWTRVAAVSYADDLRILLDRKDIQQASFCFVPTGEDWVYAEAADGSEDIKCTITEISRLYDVTVCALGAYAQTDVSVQATARGRLDRAIRQERVRHMPRPVARRMSRQTEAARRKAAIQRRKELERARAHTPTPARSPGAATPSAASARTARRQATFNHDPNRPGW